MLERETVNLWAGDGGSAKSTAAMAAAVAAVSGEDWLGRKVHAERVLYVDDKTGCIDVALDPADPALVERHEASHATTSPAFRSGGKTG